MRAWNDFLTVQETELGNETVEKWLRTLKIVNYDACNLYLEACDTFQQMWFEEHIRKKIKGQFLNNNHNEIKIHITVRNETKVPAGKKEDLKPSKIPSKQDPLNFFFDEPDPLATFDFLLESESNVLAYKLLCKATNYDPISKTIIPSEAELAAFNPIFLFGTEGTGKSHMLMATSHALKQRGLQAAYVKAETFTEHVVTAIRSGEMGSFRKAYRNIDVLLIDDVHLFSRKGATQEELFHTFNTLHLAGKQIILSANCSPLELQNIEPRLVSRFEWGIVLPLYPFDEKDMQKIFKMKAEALDVKMHPSVEEFLLSTFTNSPKSLISALESLILRHYLKAEKEKMPQAFITVLLAKQLLKDLIEKEQKNAVTSQKIINAVAEYYGIKVEDILSRTQSRECTTPRQLAMYFCRSKLKLSFQTIGDLFSRDHSTVMSSVKSIEKKIKSDDKEMMTPYVCILKLLSRA